MLGAGKKVDSIDYWAGKVRELEAAIVAARAAALAAPPCGSFFVFFNNQADAATAAQVNLHPEEGHSFRVVEAPGPEEARAPPSTPHPASLPESCSCWSASAVVGLCVLRILQRRAWPAISTCVHVCSILFVSSGI